MSCPVLKHLTHTDRYKVNHSTMVGIYIAVSCAGSSDFINESLVLLALLQVTIRYSTFCHGLSILLKLGRNKVRSILLVYRLIEDVQHLWILVDKINL